MALVAKQEADGVEIVKRIVAPGSTVRVDEVAHWDQLEGHFATKRINHRWRIRWTARAPTKPKAF
ncbi:MAG TPA: transposase [Hyphomicrobiaceae bacterium]|nr:transposase [Hyphomicrobiaceae bacterium]